MEFIDEDSLEAFVKTLPIPTNKQINLLEREVVADEEEPQVTGCKKVKHEFSIEGEE